MLCSARELGLSEDASGLFDLPADLHGRAGPGRGARARRHDLRSEPHAESRRLHERRGRRARSRRAARSTPLHPPAMKPVAADDQRDAFRCGSKAAPACPKFVEPRDPRHSPEREVAVLDAGAPASRRTATDQRRRRRHQLRDARARRSRCTRTTSSKLARRDHRAVRARRARR